MKSFRYSIVSIIYGYLVNVILFIGLLLVLLFFVQEIDKKIAGVLLIAFIIFSILLLVVLLSGKIIKKIQLHRRGVEKILNVKYENIIFLENRLDAVRRIFDYQGAVSIEILYGIDMKIKANIGLGAVATYRILKILRTGNTINIPDLHVIIDPYDPYNYYVKGYDFIDELYLMNNMGDGMDYDRIENVDNEKRVAKRNNIIKVVGMVSYIGMTILAMMMVIQEFLNILSGSDYNISIILIGFLLIIFSIISVQMLIEEFTVYYMRFHTELKR